MLSSEDTRLIALLHGGFPLTDRPFADVAAQIGWTEDLVIERLRHPAGAGRSHPLRPAVPDRAGRGSVRAGRAAGARDAQFDAVAAHVNAMPEVAHNYRREHALNMWFVVAAESPDQARAVIERIETITQLPVFRFPKEREYFVELCLPLHNELAHHAPQ